MATTSNPIAALGRRTLEALRGLGHNATFFGELLSNAPAALRRPYLVVAQVHAIGNLSLLIIMASGLAVGTFTVSAARTSLNFL